MAKPPLTFHRAATSKSGFGADMKLNDVKFLAAGEYDLVNISLIGYDPITGRTYDECQDEWDEWRGELLARVTKRRWWQIVAHFRNVYRFAILRQRLGMDMEW